MEVRPLGGRAAFDDDLPHLRFPKCLRGFQDAVEIAGGRFCQPVEASRLRIRRRQPHDDGQFLRIGRESQQIAVFPVGLAGKEGNGECRREEHPAVRSPSGHMSSAFDFTVGDPVETDPVRMRVADVIAQVHPQFPLAFPLEGIALATGTGQGRQFHGDILHPDPVIAGRRRLVLFGEPDRLPERREEEIAQVHAAGAAEVRMGEADQRRVLVAVARGGLPARIVRIRAQLDHAEGCRGPGIGMAVTARTDKGIDTLQGGFRQLSILKGHPFRHSDDQHPILLVGLGGQGPIAVVLPNG